MYIIRKSSLFNLRISTTSFCNRILIYSAGKVLNLLDAGCFILPIYFNIEKQSLLIAIYNAPFCI